VNQEEYRACMSKRMTGKTYSKEERKLAFCTSAKICSGKSSSEQEAETLCLQPKEPKAPRSKRKRKAQEACALPVEAIVECAFDQEGIVAGKIVNLKDLKAALLKCAAQEGIKAVSASSEGLVGAKKIRVKEVQIDSERQEALDVLAQMAKDYGTA
jgi:hypothetical protein